jgi:hypothetical protein
VATITAPIFQGAFFDVSAHQVRGRRMTDGLESDRNDYIRDAFGAYKSVVQERFAVYIPDRDRNQAEINADVWIRRAMILLDRVAGGATALPAAFGIWNGKEERTVIVYSHMKSEILDQHKYELRAFLHSFGREANQGEVLFEFGRAAFFINEYDSER